MDTTTPRAMVMNLQRLVLGDALERNASRQLLDEVAGGQHHRRQTPQGRRARHLARRREDRHLSGDANDSGVVWPPNRAPLIVSAYLADSAVDSARQGRDAGGVGVWKGVVREIVG